MLRIAVIGCGAIADSFHLPALKKGAAGEASIILVDPSGDRSAALARKHDIARTARSHTDVMGEIDGAIIASPHHTHVPIALDLLAAGVPVLSEKPLGTSVKEVEDVRAAAELHGVPVAVNQTRRFIPACQEVERRLSSGSLGDIRKVTVVEGDRFGWPAATPAMFGCRSGGKGVLLDIGVHVIDLLTWWFGPDLTVESYRDDSFGGSEAAAAAELSRNGLQLSVRLSWLAKQPNLYTIEGADGKLEWNVYDLDVVHLQSAGSGKKSKVRLDGAPQEFADLAVPVIADFCNAIRTGAAPRVTPADALSSMQIIEDCYQMRERFDMPWHPLQREVTS